MDEKTGFQGDMPSIWALNAKIPRTVQCEFFHLKDPLGAAPHALQNNPN
jgi:hypothetical protein